MDFMAFRARSGYFSILAVLERMPEQLDHQKKLAYT